MSALAPRGIRANNPGNLIWVDAFRWQGQLPHDPAIESRFARFAAPLWGLRALAKQLVTYQDRYKLQTVLAMVNRWAPPHENDTGAYVRFVAAEVGVDATETINVHHPETLARMVRAITRHENGRDRARGGAWWSDLEYDDALVLRAVRVALGLEAAAEAIEIAELRPATPPPATVTGEVTSETTRTTFDDPFTGGVEPPTAPPSAEHSPDRGVAMPIPAIVLALLPQLIAQLPSLARIFQRAPDAGGDRPSVSERNVQLAEKVGEIVTRATGEDTVEGAVRAIASDPATRQAADDAIRMNFADLMELARFEEQSRGKAREFAERMTTSGPIWRAAGFGAILLLLAFGVVYGGGWVLRETLNADSTDLQTRGMIIGALIGFVSQVLSYFFGSSASSRGKDQALADAAQRPR